jgi:hypothetical protein
MTICTLRTIVPYPLAGLLALLIFWTAPATGSSLRDIRIGEYDGFTRIVFELDTPVTSQTINPQDAGQLLVTLGNTAPRLVRKIPVERSAHVRNIQFWQRRGNLTTRFQMDYKNFRFEYFPLTNPPRLALDVYPLAQQSQISDTVETRQDESQIMKIRESTLSREGKTIRNSLSPESAIAAATDLESGTDVLSRNNAPPGAGDISTGLIRQAAPEPENSGDRSGATMEGAAIQPVPGGGQTASRKPNGLHFYLVIVLVAITIAILALMLIMLLARRRWTDEKEDMNVNEFLKSQDQRIETLNKRIKEQFKRYEEA